MQKNKFEKIDQHRKNIMDFAFKKRMENQQKSISIYKNRIKEMEESFVNYYI